jgi:hypothetical protein
MRDETYFHRQFSSLRHKSSRRKLFLASSANANSDALLSLLLIVVEQKSDFNRET